MRSTSSRSRGVPVHEASRSARTIAHCASVSFLIRPLRGSAYASIRLRRICVGTSRSLAPRSGSRASDQSTCRSASMSPCCAAWKMGARSSSVSCPSGREPAGRWATVGASTAVVASSVASSIASLLMGNATTSLPPFPAFVLVIASRRECLAELGVHSRVPGHKLCFCHVALAPFLPVLRALCRAPLPCDRIGCRGLLAALAATHVYAYHLAALALRAGIVAPAALS